MSLTAPVTGMPESSLMVTKEGMMMGYIHGKLHEILGSIGGGAGLATETTLAAVLAELKDDADFEEILARDTVTNIYYRLRTIRNQDTGVITQSFIDVAGATFIPVNPMAIAGTTFVSTQRTPSLVRTGGVGAGTVAAGMRYVAFANMGTVDATVLGVTLKQGESISYPPLGQSDTYDAFSYDDGGAGGDLLINYSA